MDLFYNDSHTLNDRECSTVLLIVKSHGPHFILHAGRIWYRSLDEKAPPARKKKQKKFMAMSPPPLRQN